MKCAVHEEAETSLACVTCEKAICEACATHEIDGRAACDACGRNELARTKAIGSALLAFTGVGYLAAVAIGVTLFKRKAFVGGVAAVVSIAVGRLLQIVMKTRVVTERIGRQSPAE